MHSFEADEFYPEKISLSYLFIYLCLLSLHEIFLMQI